MVRPALTRRLCSLCFFGFPLPRGPYRFFSAVVGRVMEGQSKGINPDDFEVLLQPEKAARKIIWSTIPPARNSRTLNTRSSPPLRRNPGEPQGQWRTGSEKCSNTFQKNGFLFSREELSFWQKSQLSPIQNNHKCSGLKLRRVQQENPKRWNTNLSIALCIPLPDISSWVSYPRSP